jgi:hypothetical protein
MSSNNITTKVCGIFCSSIGIVLLVGFALHYQSEVSFKANAISATGTVIHTKEEKQNTGNSGGYAPAPGGNGYYVVNVATSYISTVKFQTQQRESIEFTTTDACSSRQECNNKTVLVEYVPTAPKQARIYSDRSGTDLNIKFGVYGLFSLFCLATGVWLLGTKSRKQVSRN